MPSRNFHPANCSKSFFGRRRLAKRSHVLMEAMEPRRLLSGYTFTLADQGSNTANGIYLQDLINGQDTITGDGVSNHTIAAAGDTIILPDTSVYDLGDQTYKLPDLGANAISNTQWQQPSQHDRMDCQQSYRRRLYLHAHRHIFFGGGGSGAVATATLDSGSSSGTVVGLNITSGGTGYSPRAPSSNWKGVLVRSTIESSGPRLRFPPASVSDLPKPRSCPRSKPMNPMAIMNTVLTDTATVIQAASSRLCLTGR